MEIRLIEQSPKDFLDLLLIGDEDEAMIDRYLDRAETFVLYDDGSPRSICVVTREKAGTIEIKNLATLPGERRRGLASTLIAFVEQRYAGEASQLILGTGETPRSLKFYESRGFSYSHRIRHFFRDNYAHTIIDDGIPLDDMVYLRKALKPGS